MKKHKLKFNALVFKNIKGVKTIRLIKVSYNQVLVRASTGLSIVSFIWSYD